MATKKIDWSAINSSPKQSEREDRARRQLSDIAEFGDSISVADVLTNMTRGGSLVMSIIDAATRDDSSCSLARMQVRLRVTSTFDGRSVSPGSEFRYEIGEKRTIYDPTMGKARPITTDDRNAAMLRCVEPGDEHDLRIWRVRKLDKDCSFVCSWNDALTLMLLHSKFGLHPVAKTASGDGVHVFHTIEEFGTVESENDPFSANSKQAPVKAGVAR